MDISWDDARLFLAIAETGSLSAAARRLALTQPTVSRRLAELEASLGEALFARGVAGARPTPFGETLLEPARRMAEWAAELGRAAERRGSALEGSVRVTAPPGLAFDMIVPFAAELRAERPGLALEVISSVRYVDVARREADLALRMMRPDQKELVVVATRTLRGRPHVTPALAARLGPRPPAADVPWIAWAPPLEHTLPNPVLAKKIPGFAPAFASDDFLVQLRAAAAGLGAIVLAGMRHRYSGQSPFVPITIADLPAFETALHLVAAKSALAIPRVREVADRLARVLAEAEDEGAAPKKKRRR